jgi:hypothetical protein
MIFGGLAALFLAVLALTRGIWPEAIYTGGVGVALVIGGLMWAGRSSGTDGVTHNRRRYTRSSLVVVACVIGVGMLVAAIQLWRWQPGVERADMLGIGEPGDYSNHYFGFRVQYGADWQDATAEVRKRAAEKSSGGIEESSVLLALARVPMGDQADGASVIFAVELLPESAGVVSGADYLKRMLPRLQQRADGPKDIKEERQSIIAGLTFDRLSLRRPWGDGEVRMTYWVAVKRGYALIVTGSYVSTDGLHAIEALLARMFETTGG